MTKNAVCKDKTKLSGLKRSILQTVMNLSFLCSVFVAFALLYVTLHDTYRVPLVVVLVGGAVLVVPGAIACAIGEYLRLHPEEKEEPFTAE